VSPATTAAAAGYALAGHFARIPRWRGRCNAPAGMKRSPHESPRSPAAAVALLSALALAAAAPARAQDAGSAAPLLDVADAVDAAQRNNHAIAGTALEIDRADERAAALRTRRLPALKLDAFAGRQLNSLDFDVPAGSLGSFPPLGPIPPTSSTVTKDADWFAVGSASVGQPLTQQYRIGLGLQALRLERKVAGEELRHEKQRVAAEVRTTYFQISATEAGVLALRALIRAIEDVDAVTTRYREEDIVLRSEALEVKARLARERQRLVAAENSLATLREHLNQLMGRDVATPFRVIPPAQLASRSGGITLEAAREQARAARPEVRKAALHIQQAETAKRLARADWIPDVTLAASYARAANSGALPDQVSTVGILFSWEPWDWGRRNREASERALAIRQAREAQQETSHGIEVEVGQRWRELQDATLRLDATVVAEQAAQAYLDDTRNRYREDARMLHDVLEAEARMSRARHDHTDALAGYWSAAAELERTIGHEN
jgi:outer membrane protein TolC